MKSSPLVAPFQDDLDSHVAERNSRGGSRDVADNSLGDRAESSDAVRSHTAAFVATRVSAAARARHAGVTEVDPRVPVAKGTRVRVLSGPFVGKSGVVHEIDARGGVRVALGTVVVRVELGGVIACAEGRDRPALSISHRKVRSPRM